MSKADQLGAGRFAGGSRPVSARRAAIGAVTGVPTEGVAPPTRLPVERISPNPQNPRTTLGDLTELAGSLKEHGQKQAVTVMNRDAYLKANPESEQALEPNTTHVVVDGSSRLAAAREAGLTHLSVMVDDTQGSDGTAILESALVANIHRSDLAPLDEARALKRLLTIHGSQVKLAKRLHKSQGWVSQRLALLQLAPELQARIGEEPIELLRAVAKLPEDRQHAALEDLKTERERKTAEPARHDLPAPPPGQTTGVAQDPVTHTSSPRTPPASLVPAPSTLGEETTIEGEKDGGVGAAQASEPLETAVITTSSPGPNEQSSTRSPKTAPEPRSGSWMSVGKKPVESSPAEGHQLAYEDGASVAAHLIHMMSDTQFDRMVTILIQHQQERSTSEARTS